MRPPLKVGPHIVVDHAREKKVPGEPGGDPEPVREGPVPNFRVGQIHTGSPGVEQSGVKNRGQGITKEGRKDLRWAMVEVAQRAVKSDPFWERRFQELCRRMQRNQAIVVIAHRLLELVWFVLTRHQPYRHFTPERIAYKYLTWAWQLDENDRDGLTRQQFARYYLMRLGIGHNLEKIVLDPKHPRRLASETELLALKPELNQTQ